MRIANRHRTPEVPVCFGPCVDCGDDADTILDFTVRPVVARCCDVLACQGRVAKRAERPQQREVVLR